MLTYPYIEKLNSKQTPLGVVVFNDYTIVILLSIELVDNFLAFIRFLLIISCQKIVGNCVSGYVEILRGIEIITMIYDQGESLRNVFCGLVSWTLKYLLCARCLRKEESFWRHCYTMS